MSCMICRKKTERPNAWYCDACNRSNNRKEKKPKPSTSIYSMYKAQVYRMYGSDGALLYVGCSIQVPFRVAAHKSAKSSKRWIHKVRKIIVGKSKPRYLALADERMAIQNESPRYNIVGRVPASTCGALRAAKK